jgi:hypothetical protein
VKATPSCSHWIQEHLKTYPLCTLPWISVNPHLYLALASYTFTLTNNIFQFNIIIFIHNTRHRMSLSGHHKLMTFTQLQWLHGRCGYALFFRLLNEMSGGGCFFVLLFAKIILVHTSINSIKILKICLFRKAHLWGEKMVLRP